MIFDVLKHVWYKGHSVTTNRAVQSAPWGAKGWLTRCECGKVWAR